MKRKKHWSTKGKLGRRQNRREGKQFIVYQYYYLKLKARLIGQYPASRGYIFAV